VLANFWQVCPRDMLDKLEHPLVDENVPAEAAE